MRYFWDTIERCVPPEQILDALEDAGFAAVRRTLSLGLFSEYVGVRPGEGVVAEAPVAEGNFFLRTLPRQPRSPAA
jgi:hypothetical protein